MLILNMQEKNNVRMTIVHSNVQLRLKKPPKSLTVRMCERDTFDMKRQASVQRRVDAPPSAALEIQSVSRSPFSWSESPR